ncbi:putative bifunctional chitinase/lysozyme [Andreprevotia sp. IGB-42]|uniref:carbohydrate-binding protein n=1 Tax=Andreprevotia sp. IGB-42 TaxID=2497473 RepID=UPI0013591829|nr:carbohydrate-binding protein [Andreprevotia sp. IGB-42]KAF0812479.1 putative bifunctional chitinase/lysozyme [Andreprevotia sp. IGB-42]
MSRKSQPRALRRLQAGAVALAMGFASIGAMATEAAPYFFTWGYGESSYKFTSLVDAKQKAGLDAATLAFIITGNSGCSLSNDVDNMLSDVIAFQQQGGRLIISFGGAAGTYVEARCTGAQMATLIDGLLQRTGVRALDFDIEGSQLSVTSLNTVRNEAIKTLQAKYPDLYISFTLPTNPTGLTSEGLNLLRGAQTAGVRTDVVNIMTMDYGSSISNGKKMGDLAVQAANSLFTQIKGIYTTKSDSELWAMVGITPMIGKNDVQTEIFTVADAQQVANFAKQYGVGLLSFWALQRDRSGTGSLDDFSLTPQTDYQFYQTFKAAKTGGTNPTAVPTTKPTTGPTVIPTTGPTVTPRPSTVPTVTPVPPTPTTPPVGGCNAAWNSSTAYSGGAKVTYNGRNYQASWWTQGDIPSSNTGSGKPWVDLGPCGSTTATPVPTSVPTATPKPTVAPSTVPTATPVPQPTSTPTPQPTVVPGGCAAWVEGNTYAANSCASYGGKDYVALITHTAYVGTNWNPASTPTLWKLK